MLDRLLLVVALLLCIALVEVAFYLVQLGVAYEQCRVIEHRTNCK